MRWAALGVDYEMSGKDLIDSVTDAGADLPGDRRNAARGLQLRALPRRAGPEDLQVEGQWPDHRRVADLRLAREPVARSCSRRRARPSGCYFDVIPKAVDDYFSHLATYRAGGEGNALVANPVWHIHAGEPPSTEVPVSFALLLNLVSASNSVDRDVLWGFLRNTLGAAATPGNYPKLDELVGYAIAYFNDFVKPAKRFRAPDERERTALQALCDELAALPAGADGEAIQNVVYAVGKAAGFEPLRDWFTAIYEVLLGQSQGPRFGSFVALYGVAETRALIGRALAGDLAETKAEAG